MSCIKMSALMLMIALVIPNKYLPKFSFWLNYGANITNASTSYSEDSHVPKSRTKGWRFNKQFGFNLQAQIIETKLYFNAGIRNTGNALYTDYQYWDDDDFALILLSVGGFEYPLTVSYFIKPYLCLDAGISMYPKVNRGSVHINEEIGSKGRYQDSTNLELAVAYQRQSLRYELRYLQGLTNEYDDNVNAELYYSQIMINVGMRLLNYNPKGPMIIGW